MLDKNRLAKYSMGGGDELAKEQVSLTITSYDESSSEAARTGKGARALIGMGPEPGIGHFVTFFVKVTWA